MYALPIMAASIMENTGREKGPRAIAAEAMTENVLLATSIPHPEMVEKTVRNSFRMSVKM